MQGPNKAEGRVAGVARAWHQSYGEITFTPHPACRRVFSGRLAAGARRRPPGASSAARPRLSVGSATILMSTPRSSRQQR